MCTFMISPLALLKVLREASKSWEPPHWPMKFVVDSRATERFLMTVRAIGWAKPIDYHMGMVLIVMIEKQAPQETNSRRGGRLHW